ncbi:hypothetical protein D9758_018703 [Tetrapyrgos nigripes]|uniref:Uncharacterized protein n=1 Tax=Tetrapyrgos nigripes TaxID=182062 RepID=A0A8H5B9T6_9AGAR|nr:hypothetical protein D9758_018703 [Tetrapyrgos nigripes]
MEELHRGTRFHGSRFEVYSARHENRIVVVKEYFGSRAKQHLQQTLDFNRGLMHPRFLNVKGIPRAPSSDTQFIVFGNACSTSFELKVASALQEDQKQSIRIGFAIVGGLSVGLLPNPPTGKLAYFFSAENLEIYMTDGDELKIGFTPSKTDVAEALGDTEEDRFWKIFNESCLNNFERANRLLHRESYVAMEYDNLNNENETMILDSEPDSSEQFIGEPSPVAPFSSKARREFVWKFPYRRTSTVELVAQHYQNYLNISRLKPAGSFALRQLAAWTQRRLILRERHQCPENAIISHSTLFHGEICYLCGEQVEQVEQGMDRNPISDAYSTVAQADSDVYPESEMMSDGDGTTEDIWASLQPYLEAQTESLVNAIQSILSGVRSPTPSPILNESVTQPVTAIVSSIVAVCKDNFPPASAQQGNEILQ